ncbi:MAG: ABC transporter substrate-binding protein [bacterium]|nr:ABC transporter substrate-binding protein [bacterium]
MGKKNLRVPSYLMIGLLLCGFGSGVASAETLVIGGDAPLSGPAASWGIGQVRGVEMAMEEINSKGGLHIKGKRYTLKLSAYDNKAYPNDAASIANKLVLSENSKFILAAAVGATCRAIQTVTGPNNVLFGFSCWGKDLLGPKVPLNFRFGLSPYELSDAYISSIKKAYPNIKTIATISPNDTSGWDGAKGDIRAAKKLGIEAVAEEYYERDQQDFRATLTRILAKKPDLIDLAASAMSTGGVIMKQAYELGYRGPKAWVACSQASAAVKISGKEPAENLYLAVNWDYLSTQYTTAGLRNIVAQYKKKYNEDWDYFGVCAYVGARIVFSTMEKTGSLDPATVAEAMVKNQPYDTVFGPLIFGNAEVYGLPRNMIHPLVLSRVRDGKLENISYGLAPELAKVVGNWKFKK